MKDLKYYAEGISLATPSELVELLTEMTVDYAEVCNMMLPLERAKMQFWIDNKKLDSEKPVSDKTLEMLWMAKNDETVNGMVQKRAELYKKALEKIMSSVKAILREREIEAKNLF